MFESCTRLFHEIFSLAFSWAYVIEETYEYEHMNMKHMNTGPGRQVDCFWPL